MWVGEFMIHSPLGGFVLIKPLAAERVGQIYVAKGKSSEIEVRYAQVIAAGPGEYDEGVFVPMVVKAGDIVSYSSGAPQYPMRTSASDGSADRIMIRSVSLMSTVTLEKDDHITDKPNPVRLINPMV